ncbi:MAG: hypothetical protein JSU70_03475 [Phycisphaerales bacterium]|nr:MAG: hypothetical protein JSU70_03475 [Phycisphaerales bacterium]
MKKSDLTYVLASVFCAAVAIFYCCTMWFSVKLPRYYPLEHTWKWVKEKGVPSQGWYGMQTFAFLAGGAVTLAVYVLLKRYGSTETVLNPRTAKLLGAGVTGVVVVCMGYMLYHEFHKWGVFGAMGF